ncbi:hypothetical protein, partial [Mycolicibacterium sp.]|uniref:hypothetical protein n=1 Tax=Mycolicibacterium sp. TaxID=2320850 RepID=UPI0037C98D4B
MATWYDVRGYLGANYSIAQDAGHQVQMFCAGGDGEVQLMIVEQGNVAASLVDSWVSVSSPVGSSNYVDVNAMLAHVSQHYIVGGLVLRGTRLVVQSLCGLGVVG